MCVSCCRAVCADCLSVTSYLLTRQNQIASMHEILNSQQRPHSHELCRLVLPRLLLRPPLSLSYWSSKDDETRELMVTVALTSLCSAPLSTKNMAISALLFCFCFFSFSFWERPPWTEGLYSAALLVRAGKTSAGCEWDCPPWRRLFFNLLR